MNNTTVETAEEVPPLLSTRTSIPWIAFTVGAVCVAITVYLVTQAEVVLSTVRIGYLQLPPIAIAMLLILLMVKALLLGLKQRELLEPKQRLFMRLPPGVSRLIPFLDFSSSDILVIYCMVLVAAMVSSHGIVQKFVPGLISLNYFANAGNNWHALFDPHILARLVPYSPADGHVQPVSQNYYAGLPRGGTVPWAAWLPPILNWAVLIFLVVFAFLCLTAILRRQWVEREHLSFPLTQLPLAIIGEGEKPLLRSRLTWLGALIPIAVFGTKLLHQISPPVPDIPVFFVLNSFLPAPWSGLFFTPISISFAAVGMMYLLPVDMLLSIWFFFLMTRVQQAVLMSFDIATPGMPTMPTLLFTGYQTLGAYFVIAAYLFWVARPHLAQVWAVTVGREKIDDSQEILPYRFSVIGLFGALIAATVWLCLMGMSWWLAAGELLVYIFVIALIMARSTAEAGMLMTETTFRPVDLIRLVAPVHSLGASNITMLAFCDNLFTRDLRGLLLAGFLDSSKIVDSAKVSRRSLAGLLAAAVVLAFVIAVALNISIPYHRGANSMDPYLESISPTFFWTDYSKYLATNVTPPGDVNWQIPAGALLGLVVTSVLVVMRSAFEWWPLHPLGYALAGSWTTDIFWFPCFVAWACKSLSVRYGGMTFYTRVRPFFLGMILGEFSFAVLSVLLNMLFKIVPPAFPWT